MMKRFLRAVVAAALTSTIVSAADAAYITKTFQYEASNFAGRGTPPISSVTQTFTISFDNTIMNGFKPIVTDYSSNSTSNVFSVAPTNVSGFNNGEVIFFGLQAEQGTNDYFTQFSLNLDGDITSSSTDPSSTYRGDFGRYNAQNKSLSVVLPPVVIVTPNAAVPEPATWAMMLVGFGGIGFAMRRRKKNVTTTGAFA